MIIIDGSQGEGGGQILRTSLTLSMVTGRPFRLENIRAEKLKPGLQDEHLAALRAAAQICGADIQGVEIGSRVITFTPGPVRSGEYAFDSGVHGNAVQLMQMVLPVLALAHGWSTISVAGRLRANDGPSIESLQTGFVPLINRMLPIVSWNHGDRILNCDTSGRLQLCVVPAIKFNPVELCANARQVQATICARNVPYADINKMVRFLWRNLRVRTKVAEERSVNDPACTITVALGPATVYTQIWQAGMDFVDVAWEVVKRAQESRDAEVAVGQYFADQIVIPMALAGTGKFETAEITPHTLTAIELVREFLNVPVAVPQTRRGTFIVRFGAWPAW